MRWRKLMRTAQSEFWFLKGQKESCLNHARRILRMPAEADFACLRLLPDSLSGCFVDVGANQGQSIDAIRLFKPAARIHAYEPNPRLAATLQRRFSHNDRVCIHAAGLGAT